MDFRPHILEINNWPRLGIRCYDISPLLADRETFGELIEVLAEPYLGVQIDAVVGIEARGFLLAGAVAHRLGTGVVMIRKKGKIPPPTVAQEYSYEYASQIIEMRADALSSGAQIILIDDILATGGTMAAAVKLVDQFDVTITGISFVVEMAFMAGRTRIREKRVHSVVEYT